MALGGGSGDGADLGPIGGSKDLLFIRLPIGVNHWSICMKASMAIFLLMAKFLAELATSGFRFTIAFVSIETTELWLKWQLPLPEACRIEGLELLVREIFFFVLSDRNVTGRSSGGDGGDIATSLVVVNDLHLLSISHALMEGWFSSFHDLHPEVITEASHEKLVLKELFHVLYAICLHCGEVSNWYGRSSSGHSCGNCPDGVHGIGLGLAHFVEGLTDPQVVVPNVFSSTLHHFMEVGTSHARNSAFTSFQMAQLIPASVSDLHQTTARSCTFIGVSRYHCSRRQFVWLFQCG